MGYRSQKVNLQITLIVTLDYKIYVAKYILSLPFSIIKLKTFESYEVAKCLVLEVIL